MKYASASSVQDIYHVAYVSRATRQLTPTELLELLEVSRTRNATAGISGLLVHRQGTFLQLFEGPEHPVADLLSRIRKDTRHTGVAILSSGIADRRLFHDWSMGFEEVDQVIPQSWPGLSSLVQPPLPFEQWIKHPEIAMSFLESCSLGAWSPRVHRR